MFTRAKVQCLDDLISAQEMETHTQAVELFPKLMISKSSQEQELHSILEGYTFERFCHDLKPWLKTGSCVWFFHGNLTMLELTGIVNTTGDILKL